jgi:hypothetical protein
MDGGKCSYVKNLIFKNVAMHFPLSMNLNRRKIGLKLDFRVMIMEMTKSTSNF